MNRPIQIGDLAILSLPNYIDSHYLIIDIKHGMIIIKDPDIPDSTLKLIRKNDKWKLEDDDLDYKIRFSSKIIVTGNPEIDFNILVNLDNDILETVCKLSKYTKELCESEYFWLMKIKKEYSDFPLPDLPENYREYKELYFLINNIKLDTEKKYRTDTHTSKIVLWAGKNGYVNILEWISKHDGKKNFFNLYILKLLKDAKINFFEWIIEKYPLLGSKLSLVISYGRLDIINLMASKNIPIFPGMPQLRLAALKGYLDVLKRVFELTGALPDSKGANYALVNNHPEVVEWLKSYNIVINADVVKAAARMNNLNLLKILDSNGFHSNIEVANIAAEEGNLEILEWLENKKIIPNHYGYRLARKHKKENVMKWLEERNIYVPEDEPDPLDEDEF